MKTRHLIIIALTLTALMGCTGRDTQWVHEPMRAVYYWQTTYNRFSDTQDAWLRYHDVGRMYVHYFDVVERDGRVVPEATQQMSVNLRTMDVVPTVYVTIEALRAIDRECRMDAEPGDSLPAESVGERYARLMLYRIWAMSDSFNVNPVKEIQLDCDWTSKTRESYFALVRALRALAHEHGQSLSVTVRLHQLKDRVPPADMGVLMLYNTGNLMSAATRNSILDIDDVKPYLKGVHGYGLPLDFAYPAFGWLACYRDGKFVKLCTAWDEVPDDCDVREEFPAYDDIMAVKQLVESSLGTDHGTILFHFASHLTEDFSDEQIEDIYGR